MLWTKSLTALALVASFPQLGQSRAVPSISRSCADGDCIAGLLDRSDRHGTIASLHPRLEDKANHTFEGLTTLWSRYGHPSLTGPTRVVVPGTLKEARALSPSKPKPNSPKGTPADNPFAPLDPTKPDSGKPADPDDNPFAPLDPTKPTKKPTTADDSPSSATASPVSKTPDAPSPSPTSGGSDPAAGDQPDQPDQPGQPADKPPVIGGSDTAGDDVPGHPTTPSIKRPYRPRDDEDEEYDYLGEVQKEKDSDLVNDQLATLRNRITNPVEDDNVRLDEIRQGYTFDSNNPLPNNQGEIDLKLAEQAKDPGKEVVIPKPEFDPPVDSIFDAGVLDHANFDKLLDRAGIALTDLGADKESIRSNGAKKQTVKLSWSKDQKALFTDWSYKKFDESDMNPKPFFTELSMALLREKGVDPRKIQAIGQSRIENKAAQTTIDSIFKSLNVRNDEAFLVLSAADTDVARKDAFDAYFRTANGKGTVNMLAFHANEFGNRGIKSVVLQRKTFSIFGFSSGKHQALVVLE